jgi:hypothetical protein
MNVMSKMLAATAVASGLALAALPASAAPMPGPSSSVAVTTDRAVSADVVQAHYRRYGHRPWGGPRIIIGPRWGYGPRRHHWRRGW